jgi:drug/metabolite transporter (DMT)-like permease
MTARPTESTKFSWFLLIFANIVWASSYVASKIVLKELSVTMLLAMRLGISAIVLLPWLLMRRKELRLTRRDIWQLVLLTLIGFVLNKLLEFGGLALTSAADVALLISGESLFTAALSWLLLKERPKARAVFALLLGFFGVYLIVEQGLLPVLPAGGGIWRMLGNLLVVVALVSEALYTVRGKALSMKHSPVLITSAAIVGSALFWIPVGVGEVVVTGWHPISLATWLWLIWLAIMTTIVAYLAWFQGLAKVEGSAAASTLFIQPLLGPVFSIILLHDQLTPITIVGGALIVICVWIISRP